ncbi:MAG: diphosphomevalonate decarboxylase [Candidatus Marsarchaeota archaeon]|nr:diphosphomevalonate decarboxylase [Candidatus Marsarchaeota archaeon]
MEGKVYTAVGSPNIALVKYWGKRDEKRILPHNSSISITLSLPLYTKTSILFSKKLRKDEIYINGMKQDLDDREARERFSTIDKFREMAKSKTKALVVSYNSFPSSAGIASSASGAATLAFVASKALGLSMSQREMSIMARQISGSACRSLFGGFVKWEKGTRRDGSDSYARQIADENHWPALVNLIAIVSKSKKHISSRAGMKQTVGTSSLYKSRPGYAETASARLERAIRARDFETLAEITMKDSNSMHATMLDTWPPILYMNDVSRRIVLRIHELNENAGKTIAAYTFDAGPNAHIITLNKHKKKVLNAVSSVSGVIEVLESRPGRGPRLVADREGHLIDRETAKPIVGRPRGKR